jgi:hypothetical protein
MARVKPETLSVDRLSAGGQTFILSRPLTIHLKLEECGWASSKVSGDADCYFAEAPEIPISAFGVDCEHALEEFAITFKRLWNGIALLPDERLSSESQTVKRALLQLVDRVQE